jgi:hypothetical protein
MKGLTLVWVFVQLTSCTDHAGSKLCLDGNHATASGPLRLLSKKVLGCQVSVSLVYVVSYKMMRYRSEVLPR